MCLDQRIENSIEKVEGWKVFAENEEGVTSPFQFRTLNRDLLGKLPSRMVYELNKKIRVIPEEAVFFAFKDFSDACHIANHPERWNVISSSLLVLPVTLYDVVATGKFRVPSDDPQCLDGYYSAFESKEIEVHDTLEIRKEIYEKIAARHLTRTQLTYMEFQAFTHLLGWRITNTRPRKVEVA